MPIRETLILALAQKYAGHRACGATGRSFGLLAINGGGCGGGGRQLARRELAGAAGLIEVAEAGQSLGHALDIFLLFR